MSLRVVQVPDPPPGADWLTVVPGEYLYNVTGITGTLTTVAAPGFPNCPDVSGNAQDATYSNSGSTFVAGLVPGNNALQRNAGNGDQINCAFPLFDVSVPFTFVEWVKFDAPGPNDIQLAGYGIGAPTFAVGWTLNVPTGFPNRFFVTGTDGLGATTQFATANGTVPYDSAPHMIAVTFDPGANPQNNVYLDGVLLAWDVTDDPFAFNGNSDGWSFNIGYSPKVTDEIVGFPVTLAPGDVAALYAAGAAFATWDAEVVALGPYVYYHLDGASSVGGPRQVTLAVESGITELLEIPSGFPLATGAGPYAYSWQPNLNSSTQNLDGSLTTVAIPALVLPAGYVISSETLDLTPTDQWSQVRLWWDSNIMDAQAAQSAYLFPPPVHLVYHQEPH